MPDKYWIEAVESELDEVGLVATKEQVLTIAAGIEMSAKEEQFGPPIEAGYSAVGAERKRHAGELKKLRATHQDELRKQADAKDSTIEFWISKVRELEWAGRGLRK